MKTEFIYEVLAELCNLDDLPHTCSVFGSIHCGGVCCGEATTRQWSDTYKNVNKDMKLHISTKIELLVNSHNPKDVAESLSKLFTKNMKLTRKM